MDRFPIFNSQKSRTIRNKRIDISNTSLGQSEHSSGAIANLRILEQISVAADRAEAIERLEAGAQRISVE